MTDRKALPFIGPVLLAALLGLAGPVLGGENIDPAGDDHQYAWGENVGWVNAEPSGDGGPGAEVTDSALTGWLWGENIGWISLSCTNTSSCGVTSYGVTNDGFGQLAGLAWSENAGWIDFGPTTCEPDPTCGVEIDPSSGYFGGRAWGENIGWITFSPGAPQHYSARTAWCQGTPAAPGLASGLTVAKVGPQQQLSWTPVIDASWYDVVSGSLASLRSSGGDFTVATRGCTARRLGTTSHLLSEPDPTSGNGNWYLVRGANCKGHGSYDSGSPSQVGLRDPEIAASPFACP